MVEDAISFWTDIQRYEDMLAADSRSYCFVPLSELYRKLGLLDDAISVAAKGCSVHPDYAGGFYALGAAYSAKGEKAEARKALERAVSLKADHLEAMKLLGQLYVEEGRMDLAEKVLQEVLREHPDDTETALLLHSIASRGATAEPEEEVLEEVDVIEDLTEVLEEPAAEAAAPQAPAPSEAAAAQAPAPAEAAAESFYFATEEAETVWEGWEESAGEAAPGGEALAPVEESADFWAIGSPEEATPAEEFEGFEEPEPLRAFEEAEEPEAAAAAKEPAAPAARRDPLSTATLAELYVSQGFTEKAVKVYQDLIATDPSNDGYRRRLAELAAAPREAEGAGAPAARREPVYGQGGLEADLTLWLENIRRRRDGV